MVNRRARAEMEMKTVLSNPYTTELLVAHAYKLSARVQLFVSDRKQITKTPRDPLALAYWTILFNYQHGMLTLLRNGNPTAAFALLRVFEEAFLKLFLVMFGTDRQVQAIWEGTYSTDFAAVGQQLDAKLGSEPLFGPKLKSQVRIWHEFTHTGPEQTLRQLTKMPDGSVDVAPNYADEDVRRLVIEAMSKIFLAGAFMTEFFNYADENRQVVEMFNEFIDTQTASLDLDKLLSKPPQPE
jgi:hypothetical protein